MIDSWTNSNLGEESMTKTKLPLFSIFHGVLFYNGKGGCGGRNNLLGESCQVNDMMFIYVIQWRHFEGHLSKFETYFFFLVLLYVKTSSSDVWSGRRELVCMCGFIYYFWHVLFFFLSQIFFKRGRKRFVSFLKRGRRRFVSFFLFKTLARALEISFSCTRKRKLRLK